MEIKELPIENKGNILFEFKKGNSFLTLGKPKDSVLRYQWQIFDFQGNTEDFKDLWRMFLSEHKCRSCICELNLSFLKNFEFKKINGLYSYYPFSVVYRVDDITDGKFYVGMCEVEEKWRNGYTGSGGYWNRHKNAHKDHEYIRTVLKENFDIPLDTRNFEYQEIEKVFEDENCCNTELRTQGQEYSYQFCPECGGKGGHHKKGCSKYIEPTRCLECGKIRGHKAFCSKTKTCPECGGKSGGHLKTCSRYKLTKYCPECGKTYGHHKETCSKCKICPECNGIDGTHFKTCSQYTPPETCPECGSISKHKKSCSLYKESVCPECGGVNYCHRKGCSEYKRKKFKPILKTCKYCEYSLQSRKHAKNCPLYKEPKKCPECGHSPHLKSCSKYKIKPCDECGGVYGYHRESCSKYKGKKQRNMNGYMNQERPGFSGLNHVLIAIALFFLMKFIPIEPFLSFFQTIISDPIIGVMCFLVVCGGALLPDLDNLKKDGGSAAAFDLGFLGSVLSSFMVTISSIMTSVFKGKKDIRRYESQHRFFWHTLFVPLVMFLLMYFFIPESDTKLIDVFRERIFPTYAIVVLFLILICVYVGSMMLLKKLNKFPMIRIKPSMIALILSILSVAVCIAVCNETTLKLVAYCVALGYTFHLFGDGFADGGVPLLFPITGIFGKFFMKIHFIPRALTVTTGSTLESLLKIVFFAIDCVLAFCFFYSINPFDITF